MTLESRLSHSGAGRIHPAFIGTSAGRDYAAPLQLNENG
jgi:hypothetical protein